MDRIKPAAQITERMRNLLRPEQEARRTIWFALHFFFVALTLAAVEVQIEGANGWASNLPTWRTTSPALTWLSGGRPLTGYHIALTVLLLLLLHWPVQFAHWGLVQELKVLFAYLNLAVVWDFLWFVINPNFGLGRYDAAHVWWFKHWLLGLPVDYYVGLALAVAARTARVWAGHERPSRVLREMALFYLVVAVLVLATCLAARALHHPR